LDADRVTLRPVVFNRRRIEHEASLQEAGLRIQVDELSLASDAFVDLVSHGVEQTAVFSVVAAQLALPDLHD